jgi:hypothetical protein
MPLAPAFLPTATPLDLSEEPASSIDPIGTLAHAERLAEILLPGFTARMWRTRLLTLAAATAAVADRALRQLDDKEEARLDVRLAFERLLVSAIIRTARNNRPARARLPGSMMAESALAADNQPLTRSNFLKGQAVNGPFGVISRLGRHLGVIDEDGRLGGSAPSLLAAWASDQNLHGILDEDRSGGAGAKWIADAARQTARFLRQGEWPGPASGLWRQWAEPLLLNGIASEEKRVIVQLLDGNPIRRRMLAILRQRIDVYVRHADDGRGVIEREVMLALVPLGDDATDRVIGAVRFASIVYEETAALMQQAFDGVLWGLKHLGGQATPGALLENQAVKRSFDGVRAGLSARLRTLEAAADRLEQRLELTGTDLAAPIRYLRGEAAEGSTSSADLLGVLMRRHSRVQRQKRKGQWIDDGDKRWALLPGFAIGGELPPEYDQRFIHPFRIVNAYSLLADLGEVNLEPSDGQD